MERLLFILSFSYLLIHYFSSSPHFYWTMLSTGGTTTKRKKPSNSISNFDSGQIQILFRAKQGKGTLEAEVLGSWIILPLLYGSTWGQAFAISPWGWGRSRWNHRQRFGASSSPGPLLHQAYSHSLMTYWLNSFSWAMALQPLNGKKTTGPRSLEV